MVCTLGYPNREVAEAMSQYLAHGFSELSKSEFSSVCARIFDALYAGEPEEALAQIEEKGYAAKFASDPRKLFKIGCAFDWDARNLGRWLIG